MIFPCKGGLHDTFASYFSKLKKYRDHYKQLKSFESNQLTIKQTHLHTKNKTKQKQTKDL